MNHARQESCQRDTEGLTKGLGQGPGNAVFRNIDQLSTFKRGGKRDGRIDPIAGEGIGNNALSGDILVDVDAGSLGTGLVIWIMGG